MTRAFPYVKDFDDWNRRKKVIESRAGPRVRVGEVWWVHLGLNIGREQDGSIPDYLRPCVVVRRFPNATTLVLPCTTNMRSGGTRFGVTLMINGVENVAIVSQARTVDERRMDRRIACITRLDYMRIMQALIGILENETPD